MQDIADKVGVSKALVSLVFRKAPGPSDETGNGCFAAAERTRATGSTAPRR